MFVEILSFINQIIESIGYIGIFLLMALESSFFPFPSEIVMIPAGYLASLGSYNIYGVIIAGLLGSLVGALFNYYFAKKYGLELLARYGKYIGIKKASLDKMMKFFASHGLFGTFIGRLLPGIRQYISLPAGLVNMNIVAFSVCTSLGALIWVSVLALLGYSFGNVLAYDNVVAQKLSIFAILNAAILLLSYILVKRIVKNQDKAKLS
ncbi:MAG: DedA family protein [Rickettsiales bacterium]|jgi:membrane protein DedA with SNARE-associated domain|nr:DedA family protein [Rickettsiales bacterium]